MGSCRYVLRAATPALQLPARKRNVLLGPVSQSATRLVIWLPILLVSCPSGRSAARPVGWSAACPVNHPSGWLPVQSVGHPSGGSISRASRWLAAGQVGQLAIESVVVIYYHV
jgi:hypothetical protein